MVKNKLETIFSKSMKVQFPWGMKLHNNMLAHQTTPADYIVSLKIPNTIGNMFNFLLIECKQVTCKEGKGRLSFKRLKQMHDLLAFEKIHGPYSAFFCIAFWDGRWTNSEVYLIPVNLMHTFVNDHFNVSVNRTDMRFTFRKYQVELEGGVLQLQKKLESI